MQNIIGKRVPPGHWKNIENHKKYIEWLKQKLGYTTMEDWYKTIGKNIRENGGAGLILNIIGNSCFPDLLNSGISSLQMVSVEI